MNGTPEKSEADHRADLAYPLNADSPFAAPFLDRNEPTAFHFVEVTELDDATIDLLIPTVLAEMKDRALIPVFIADLGAFAAFRKHEVIFETLPDAGAGHAALPALDWAARRADCLLLLQEKWKPQGTTRLDPRGAARHDPPA